MVTRYRNASINPSAPRALAVCDRCGMLYNHKDLNWETQWRGPKLQNLMILVCDSCLDKPQEQLRMIVIPADPIPIVNPRQEQYDTEVRGTPSTSDELLLSDGSSFLLLIDGLTMIELN